MELKKPVFLVTTNIILLLASCTKDVINVKLPDFEQKLVLTSFISPDIKSNEIAIGCTESDFGKLLPPDIPGQVSAVISDGTNEVRIDTMLLDSEYFDNRIQIRHMSITEGKSYKIKVVNEKGQSAEASCTVPIRRDFHIEVDTTVFLSSDPWSGKKYSTITAKISITDFPGESNYYRLIFSTNGLPIPYSIKEIIISDKGRDGEKIVLQSITFGRVSINPNPQTDSSFLRIYLLNTNEAYYDYHKSYLTSTLGNTGPFTEPSPLYSNVSNGVGIFAAYTIDSLIFRIR
jgi:hypothetical protein